MKVAVTGGRGWVGQCVVTELIEHGHELRLLVRTPWKAYPQGAEVVTGVELTDFDQVKQAFAGCDAVMHLANIPGPLDENRPETFINNMTVNYNVLLAAGLLGIERVVMASSVCATGFCRNHHYPDPDYFPLDEEHPCRPDDTYGISKCLSEILAERMVQRFPFMVVPNLRITAVYDPEKSYAQLKARLGKRDMGALNSNFGSYVDARDSARAFRMALTAPMQGAENFYILNPETASDVPTMDFVRERFPHVPIREPIPEFGALEKIEKAKRILGWEPIYHWREEVAKLED